MSSSASRDTTPSMRSQLVWASLFPLAFFGLLSMLVTASALNQLMISLVTQRNTAQAQVAAAVSALEQRPWEKRRKATTA